MKKVNGTFAIPKEIMDLMHKLIGRRGISAFVASALTIALNNKVRELQTAYEEADHDPDREETLKD